LGSFVMNLKDRILKELTNGDKTIPDLCRAFPEITNEFRTMREVANLEYSNKVELKSFDRIYREDGGAIYLAKYGIKARNDLM
jgi:hypothetical protein